MFEIVALHATVLLITPPFTQLNTPYPATAYLKGFLNTRGISARQADLGIETILELFSKKGLESIFDIASSCEGEVSAPIQRMLALRHQYIATIDNVVRFLQGGMPELAHRICSRGYLPEGIRFANGMDMDWAFGNMGIQDRAKYLATMYLEDLSDLIKECVDLHFGFSRYAERLGRSANTFDELYDVLQGAPTHTDMVLLGLLKWHLEICTPKLVALSVPFPGNLYSAFRCAQYIRNNYPDVRVAMGGGFANTELRSLTDERVFEYFHFVTLDDGEAPIEQLVKYIGGEARVDELKRTYLIEEGKLRFINNLSCSDYRQGQVGTPDYSDLPLHKYISAIEVANPMHSLWSDGRWNKLTMAHGCYWGKCTFCDTSLDYISRYEPLTAAVLCDRIEELIAQTGFSGFHFVDEAAPPALMRSLAIEILRRGLVISWWTNIRFEKAFTRDLCMLLKASGCIAVSGGLEVASDRLLGLIQKGITVAQVARVNKNFTEAGIMVHAYLMYGFPTQTAQETIDSMEMVRQMFLAGILKSGFWHRFALTAHSPVGLQPDAFGIEPHIAPSITFANNDVDYTDKTGADHDIFTDGLKTSIHNYMHAVGLEYPLHKWFEVKVPRTTIAPNHITSILEQPEPSEQQGSRKVIWIGNAPTVSDYVKSHKGNQWEMCLLTFETAQASLQIRIGKKEAEWLLGLLPRLHLSNIKLLTLAEVEQSYESAGLEDFELFWDNKPMNTIYKAGLLVV